MYKQMLNSVVEISVMSVKYFEYYTIILRGGRFFVDTLACTGKLANTCQSCRSWRRITELSSIFHQSCLL